MNRVDKNEQYELILEEYPEYISKEQMYKLCHISKYTAQYLLESGLVPSTCSGKKTRKYKIATSDVVRYLQEREIIPERYFLPEGYRKKIYKSQFNTLAPETIEKMCAYYERHLSEYSDVMNVQQVSEFTGYTDTTVVRWCAAKKLHRFRIRNVYKIPKISLIDFLMSVDFRGIRTKSEKHRDFIMDFQILE